MSQRLAGQSEVDDLPGSTKTPLPSNSTETSQFLDSAIGLSKNDTQSVQPNDAVLENAVLTVALSERLEHLTTAAWEAEQDRRLSESWMRRLHEDLNHFENDLYTGPESEDLSESLEFPWDGTARRPLQPEQDERLNGVLEHLSETISAMRLRQQEHQHLNQLSRTKLHAVAQRCLMQERQLRESDLAIQGLRQENGTLSAENATLRTRVKELEVNAARREVAVHAMTSTVAGLEGYIEDARHAVGGNNFSPGSGRALRRTVIRGSGRFRGKYYIDETESGDAKYEFDGRSDANELQEGIRAWLRGFKDVEEEAKSTGTVHLSKKVLGDPSKIAEDWGEF